MFDWSAFIGETRGDRFVWGENDCALWAASGIARATGIDPAEKLRGTYNSAFSCRRVIMKNGGLVTLCDALMRKFTPGEIQYGPCLVRAQSQTVCGILSGGRVFLKTDRGILMPEKFQILRSWIT